MDASIRNALGDIGNRIGLGNIQLGPLNKNEQIFVKPSLQPPAKAEDGFVQTKHHQLTFTKTNTTSSSTTTTTMTSSVSSLLGQVENKTNKMNASSAMILDESSTDDVELESESEIDDDENEEEEEDVINDIDAADEDNPQLCSTYVREIYSYLTHLERKYRVSPQFLEQKIVTAKMRSVLIDWLIQVHLKFHLLQETMYLCVNIIDAYLQRHDVSKMQLQLVGVTALFLASKYEEMYVPAIEDFAYMTDNTYTKGEIRMMEISICKTLDFGFGKPLALHFLRRFSKAGGADPKQHTLAKYFMELSLHDAEFASMDPSFLAACSLCLSFKLLNGSEWNKTLEFYSGYKQSDLWTGMQLIAKLCLKASSLDYKYRAATNKYSNSKLMRISLIPELSGKFIKDLATKTLN